MAEKKTKTESTTETAVQAAAASTETVEADVPKTVAGRKYKLRDPNTVYVDANTGWSLTRDQAKELPKNPTNETIERIKSGFLVEG